MRSLHWQRAAAYTKSMARFTIGDFSGYSGEMEESVAEALLELEEVEFVEAVTRVWASGMSPSSLPQKACTTQNGATWGLDRISEKALNLDNTFSYTSTAGAGVTAYIIDTGILIKHVDFGTRAVWGSNFVGDGQNTDCNGHGTHVAGTVAGKTWGVAKSANLVAVKVLGCDGSGTNAGVVQGIQWAAAQAKGKKAVANMSLGGPVSTATDNAVKAAVAGGLTMAVAAGNENADACGSSPARVKEAISVGATAVGDDFGTEQDVRASFSNYGTCVAIFAPGQLITSDWIGSSNTATKTISGTSMAAPHVCGAAALYLGTVTSATPAQVSAYLLAQATPNLINLECQDAISPSVCPRSPNKLLYTPC